MKKHILMIILTLIMISVAIYGKMVDSKINNYSGQLVKNNLDPQPWLSKAFDYYGSPIQSYFTGRFDSIKAKDKIEDIKAFKRERDSVWSLYLKCDMSSDEQVLVNKVNLQIKEADEVIDELISNVDKSKNLKEIDSIVNSGEIDELINPIMDDTNKLIDLQSAEGTAIIKDMQSNLETFSAFMVGTLALSFVLLGNIVMQYYKDLKASKTPAKKTPVKKKPVIKKKPVTKKK
jgi:hypothetical protein